MNNDDKEEEGCFGGSIVHTNNNNNHNSKKKKRNDDDDEEDNTTNHDIINDGPAADKESIMKLYPYHCCIEIILPTLPNDNIITNNNTPHNNMAQQLQKILQVDPELTKQTYKVITTRCSSGSNTATGSTKNDSTVPHDDDKNEDRNVLVIDLYAQQCKGLRVSVSSLFEYLQVAIKCYTEFG